MPVGQYLAPDVYIEEKPGPRPIQAVGTSTAGFVGCAPNKDARKLEAVFVTSWSDFVRQFAPDGSASTNLSYAVRGFFDNGGTRLYVCNTGDDNNATLDAGLAVLETIDEIAIVAAPGWNGVSVYNSLLGHCLNLKDRVAILDTQEVVDDLQQLVNVGIDDASAPASGGTSGGKKKTTGADAGAADGGAAPTPPPGLRPPQQDQGYGAIYYPWILVRDPLAARPVGNAQPANVSVPPSGHIAGIWARSDATRGVHKAPANELIYGALGLTKQLTRADQEILNPAGVNAIRFFSTEGIKVMGARTVASPSSDFRYLNVRRLLCMIEESIAESMRWVIFEPNNIPLWKSIERDVTAFLIRLWRDGALMGATPDQGFFVKCDAETNPVENINDGQVTTVIGLAPVKPAEFVIFQITQDMSGTQVQSGGNNA